MRRPGGSRANGWTGTEAGDRRGEEEARLVGHHRHAPRPYVAAVEAEDGVRWGPEQPMIQRGLRDAVLADLQQPVGLPHRLIRCQQMS